MKNLLIIGLLLVTALPATGQFEPNRHVVKFHGLHMFGSTFKAGYEHFGESFKRSVVVQVAFTASNLDNPRFGVEGELQYRLYPVQNFFTGEHQAQQFFYGFYFAPYVGYRYLEREETAWIFAPGPGQGNNIEYTAYYNSYRLGTNIGYQIAIFNNIFFDLSMGGGVKLAETRYSPIAPPRDPNRWGPEDDGIIWPGYRGVYPRVDFSIGFAL